MTGSGMSPCAACKLLRRRCTRDCVFAPHFPPDEPQKFANVHKVFGAANVNKMLQELPMDARGDAVSSMVYEADARVRDPVYGCVGAISSLQQQVAQLQTQLAVANAEIVCMRMHTPDHSTSDSMHYQQQQGMSSPLQPQSPELQNHYRDHYSPELQNHYRDHYSPELQNHYRDHYRPTQYHRMDNAELAELLWT